MKRILITDDSSIMRRNLRAILSQAGYEVAAEASNGEEALLAYRKFRPDLVTMDLTMPVMDGLEAVKRIIREDPHANIIVISAFDQRNMLFEALENGARQYLIKPITADKLLTAARSLLKDGAPGYGERAGEGEPPDTRTDGTGPYFEIENRDGRFVISFVDPHRQGPYAELQTAVQGLLFVKPLDIQFRFGRAAACHPKLTACLESLIGSIRRSGGSASVSADDENLASALRNAVSVPIAPEGRLP